MNRLKFDIICLIALFSFWIILISLFFKSNGIFTLFYIIYFICMILLLLFMIIVMELNYFLILSNNLLSSFKQIKLAVMRNNKVAYSVFLFFQLINFILFGEIVPIYMKMEYQTFFDVLCITCLFFSSWLYYDYYDEFKIKFFRNQFPRNLGSLHLFFIKTVLFFFEIIITIYQIFTIIIFVLLTNTNINQLYLVPYLKLLFILFTYRILGNTWHKYIRALLLNISIIALISYQIFIFANSFHDGENMLTEKDDWVGIFLFTFCTSLLLFSETASYLKSHWNEFRFRTRPRINLDLNLIGNHNGRSVGINEEELKKLKKEIYTVNKNSDLEMLNLENKVICSICTFDINEGDEILKLMCTHTFHFECIIPWFQINKLCPNCRHVFQVNNSQENIVNIPIANAIEN